MREALEEQRRRFPGVGEASIFPAPDSKVAFRVDVAPAWLQEAEKAARSHPVKGFGWHALRRRWANKMKDASPVDVAALGGWSVPHVMQKVYQRTTVEDMDRTLNGADPGRAAEGQA